jgi:Cytosine/uracil/thiamine/allantoin permeases
MDTPGDPHGSNGRSSSGSGPAPGASKNNFARSRSGPRPPQRVLSPEEGCIGCLIGTGILVVSVIIWGIVYWLNAEQFRPPPVPGDIPAQQGQAPDRERLRELRQRLEKSEKSERSE